MSQKYWHAKPENRNYWRGVENVRRVQEWRQAHPQYWKRPKTKRQVALQDDMAVPAQSDSMTDKSCVALSKNGQCKEQKPTF